MSQAGIAPWPNARKVQSQHILGTWLPATQASRIFAEVGAPQAFGWPFRVPRGNDNFQFSERGAGRRGVNQCSFRPRRLMAST